MSTVPFLFACGRANNMSILSIFKNFSPYFLPLSLSNPPPLTSKIFFKFRKTQNDLYPHQWHLLEGRLRIFWKLTLLPVCSVASFCWKSRGLREIYLLLQFSRYRHAVCGILLTTKLSTNGWNRFFYGSAKSKNFFDFEEP